MHFGGDENLVAFAGGADTLANIALVVVHLRGVDVAVAVGDGLLDQPRAVLAAQRPGAEPDQRDLRSRWLRRLRCAKACPTPAHAAD